MFEMGELCYTQYTSIKLIILKCVFQYHQYISYQTEKFQENTEYILYSFTELKFLLDRRIRIDTKIIQTKC